MQKRKGKPALAISLGEECNTGLKRDENQDSIAHGETPLGEMFILSDGVGGYYGGAEASAIVTSGMLRHMTSLGLSLEAEAAVTEAARRVNAEVYAAGQSGDASRRRMSATLVFALLARQPAQDSLEAIIGNVGDSRAYLLRNGQLAQLSTDHTAVQGMVDAGVLHPEQAVSHPQASVLTKTMGQGPDVSISLRRLQVQAGDQLLLCSDGLHAFVSPDAIVAAMTDSQKTVKDCSSALLDFALGAGGPDNISIQVIRLSQVSAAAAKKRTNYVKWASIAAGVILIASLVGVKLYQMWQLRPLAPIVPIAASAVSGAKKISKSAEAVLNAGATAGEEITNRSAKSDSPTTQPSNLHVGGLLPRVGTERTWFLKLENRTGPLTEIGGSRRIPCGLLEGETPIAYYSEDVVRQQFPASDREMMNHYTFRPYTQAAREACGDFDLLLLPARRSGVPEDLKDKFDAGKDRVTSAGHRVTDVLNDH